MRLPQPSLATVRGDRQTNFSKVTYLSHRPVRGKKRRRDLESPSFQCLGRARQTLVRPTAKAGDFTTGPRFPVSLWPQACGTIQEQNNGPPEEENTVCLTPTQLWTYFKTHVVANIENHGPKSRHFTSKLQKGACPLKSGIPYIARSREASRYGWIIHTTTTRITQAEASPFGLVLMQKFNNYKTPGSDEFGPNAEIRKRYPVARKRQIFLPYTISPPSNTARQRRSAWYQVCKTSE